jgi:myo-inositol-1(or 4)-monophosphatase
MFVVRRSSAFASTAIDAATQAGKLLRQMLPESRASKEVTTKRNASDFVTRGDRMAEALIVRILRERFPDHAILAEEGTSRAGADFRWIIDPVDGTTNFVHGVPLFAVSIALEHRGELTAGVVYHPSMDELFVAERGGGAFLRRPGSQGPIRVSDIPTVSNFMVATGQPYDVDETGRNVDQTERLMRIASVRITGSAALHLAYVAAGRLEVFWEPGLSPWDYAAGALLVQEAGGRVSDLQGRPFHIDCRDVLASNGHVHDEMVRLLGWKAG